MIRWYHFSISFHVAGMVAVATDRSQSHETYPFYFALLLNPKLLQLLRHVMPCFVFRPVVRCMCDTWRRLVFRRRCQPWAMFEFGVAKDDRKVELLTEWADLKERCQKCFDDYSEILIDDLTRDQRSHDQASDELRDGLSLIRCSTVLVENQHTLLQDIVNRNSARGKCFHYSLEVII